MADSQTAQPNNGNTRVTVGLNLDYFKTMPAILKGVSVFVGLIAMALTAHVYNEGHYFNFDYEDSCHRTNAYYAKRIGYPKVCPISLLVTPFVFVLAFTWTGTCVMLIVLLFIDLNKKQLFPTVDFIGHLVAGGLAILSGLCLFGYSVMVFVRAECKVETSAGRKAGIPSTHAPRKGRAKFLSDCKTCAQCESEKYGHWHILFGAIFAFGAGALYIVIALFLKKGSGKRPMMTGKGPKSMPPSQAPSQAPMQTQGTPSQQANSVKQSPSTKTGSPSQAAENA